VGGKTFEHDRGAISKKKRCGQPGAVCRDHQPEGKDWESTRGHKFCEKNERRENSSSRDPTISKGDDPQDGATGRLKRGLDSKDRDKWARKRAEFAFGNRGKK